MKNNIITSITAFAFIFCTIPIYTSAVNDYSTYIHNAINTNGEESIILYSEPNKSDPDMNVYAVLSKNGEFAFYYECAPIVMIKVFDSYTEGCISLPEGAEIIEEDAGKLNETQYQQFRKKLGNDFEEYYFVKCDNNNRKEAVSMLKHSGRISEIKIVKSINRIDQPLAQLEVITDMTANDYIALYPELGLKYVSDGIDSDSVVLNIEPPISNSMADPLTAYNAMIRLYENTPTFYVNPGLKPWDGGVDTEKTITTTCVIGDANCDDKVTVSDAVAVLQYIANAEKYPMSEQARFNADIDGEEGITGGDAIAIQKIDAGTWDI